MALHIQIKDSVTGEVVPCGDIVEFSDAFITEVGGVATVFSRATFMKRSHNALVRLFQSVRDKRERKPEYKIGHTK